MDHWDGEARGTVGGLLAAYACWLLTMALALAAAAAWYNALIRLYIALRWYRYGLAAYTYTILIALILAWLILVIATESTYRRAAERHALARRAAWLLGVLAAVAIVGVGVGRVV